MATAVRNVDITNRHAEQACLMNNQFLSNLSLPRRNFHMDSKFSPSFLLSLWLSPTQFSFRLATMAKKKFKGSHFVLPCLRSIQRRSLVGLWSQSLLCLLLQTRIPLNGNTKRMATQVTWPTSIHLPPSQANISIPSIVHSTLSSTITKWRKRQLPRMIRIIAVLLQGFSHFGKAREEAVRGLAKTSLALPT
jgi:hypothetical protein